MEEYDICEYIMPYLPKVDRSLAYILNEILKDYENDLNRDLTDKEAEVIAEIFWGMI